MGLGEFPERLVRFHDYLEGPEFSYPGMFLEPRFDELNALTVAFVETTYPEGLDGAYVLAHSADPVEADQLVRSSAPLLRLQALASAAAGTGFYTYLSHGRAVDRGPSQGVMAAGELSGETLGGKPVEGALFTSEASGQWPGPWHIYASARAVHEPPWQLWNLWPAPEAAILRISSAREWCEFVTRFPHETFAGLTPDWRAVARRWDAVSLDFVATAALDAVGFKYKGAVIAPTFWGVPTTVWLSWEIATVKKSDLPRQF